MNKDINKTLMALVPILKMNGENVTNIEAVHDWYKVGDREYMKEVAEITYDNGTVRYADIGCDSNLTAIYDVIAVIQQIKPRSKAIERIERGVYSLPSAQPKPRYTEEELRVFAHGISLSLLSKRSSQHWHYDEDTATEIKFLERLYDKVSADMKGGQG